MYKWRFFTIVFLFVFGAFLTFFKGSFFKGPSSQTLRISLISEPQSMDVARCHDLNTEQVLMHMFEGLMRKDGESIPQKALAEKIEISADQKTYTFSLKPSLWSDGTPLTAYDFEYAWKRVLDSRSKFVTRSPHYFYDIKHAKKSLLGELSVDEVAIRAISKTKLVVELERLAPYFLEILSLPLFAPIPKHIAEKDPDWRSKVPLVSNGPFSLKEWKKDNHIILDRNPNYWDKGHVCLEEIQISIIKDPYTTFLMFEKGELDWVGSPFVRLSQDISSKILNQTAEDSIIYWFMVNLKKYPFNHKKIRQALSFAIDREEIVQAVFHEAGVPRISVLPPNLGMVTEFPKKGAAQAQQLFKEALEELGISEKEFPEITLSYVMDIESHRRIAQAIQNQWRKVLGLKKVFLQAKEWNVHFNQLLYKKYDIGFLSWNVSVLDPYFILQVFTSKGNSRTVNSWESPQYEQLLDQAAESTSSQERLKYLKQAEEMLYEEMPLIPLCNVKKRYAKNPRLQGEYLSPFQLVDFKFAYLKEEKSP